jgi:hypothetical protein
MFFLIANVTETLETASEFGQNAQRGALADRIC